MKLIKLNRVFVFLAILMGSCATSKEKPSIIQQDGTLIILRDNFYFFPSYNVSNIDTLNNQKIFPLFIQHHTIYDKSIRADLKKDPIVVLQETDPPNIRFVDTLYFGNVTLYYKKDLTLLAKGKNHKIVSSVDFKKLDSSKISLLINDKYPADIYFIVPFTSSTGIQAY